MYKVKIDLPDSGVTTYAEFSTGSEKVQVQSGFQVRRTINKNGNFENSKTVISFNNLTGYWNDLMKTDDQYLLGQTLEIYNNDDLLFTGKISDFPKCKPNIFKIEADTLFFGFDDPPNPKIKASDFANVPVENDGKYGNIIYGDASDESGTGVGILTARLVDTNRYLAAWHHLKSLTAAYNSSGTLITGSCSLVNHADGNAYLDYASSDLEIYFNCEGMASGGVLITDPAKQLDDLNDNFGDFTLTGISDATTIYTERDYLGVLIINDGALWKDIFKNFSLSFDTVIYQKANGNVGLKVNDWGGTEAPVETITFIEYDSFQNWRDSDDVIDEYKRNYWYHFRNGSFQRTPQDITSTTSWNAKESSLDQKYCKDNATSYDSASRSVFIKSEPRIWYELTIPYSKLGSIDLASTTTITPPRGYYEGEERKVQIYKIGIFSNTQKIKLTVLDVSDIIADGIILKADADPDIYLLIDESGSECGVLI